MLCRTALLAGCQDCLLAVKATFWLSRLPIGCQDCLQVVHAAYVLNVYECVSRKIPENVQSDARIRRENIAKANKKGIIPKKMSLVVYVIVLILAVAARTVQLYTNMNFNTNRYIDPSPLKNYTLMILIPGFALLAFVLLAGSARDKVVGSCILLNPWRLRYDRLKKKIPTGAGYSALLMGVLMLAQMIFEIASLVHKNTLYMETLTKNERSQGEWLLNTL